MDLPFESPGHRAAWVLAAGLFTLALAGLAGWAGSRWLQRRRGQAARVRFASQLAAQEAAAREQLAEEIQNGFGHRLVLLRNGALTALAQPGSPPKVQDELNRIAAIGASALDDARAIAERLRPVDLERLDFSKAVEELLARHLTQPGIRVFKDVDDLGGAVSPPAVLYFYRLLETMLRAVGQQVGVTTVLFEVKLEREQVRLRLEHDGPGRPAREGEGLAGMAERMKLMGGEWCVCSGAGSGTRWQVLLPRVPAQG